MRSLFIVVSNPRRKLGEDRIGRLAVIGIVIVSLERSNERCRHAIRSRTVGRGKAGPQTKSSCQLLGVFGDVDRASVRQPLNRMRSSGLAKALLERLEDELLDVIRE